MSAFVGIDVSKATLDIAVLHQGQATYCQLANTSEGFEELHCWLQSFVPIMRIGLEASGRYGEPLVEYLFEQGYAVSYLNPRQISDFARFHLRYTKTDKQDAHLIAHFCQMVSPDLWQPQPTAYRLVKERRRRLKALETMRQQEVNRLQSGIRDPFVCQQLHDHIAHLDCLIQQTQQTINELIQQDQRLRNQQKLLTTIPGIGAKTATLFLAEIGDVQRFASARQLAAYIGVTPQHFQSGTSVHKRSGISKQGNARLREGLYMPAIVATRWNKPCSIFAQRLQAAHKPGKVRVIAVMRKLIHQIFGILKSGQPFDPDFGLTT